MNECTVSAMRDEEHIEMACTTIYLQGTVLYYILNNVQRLDFMLCMFTTLKKVKKDKT